MNSLDSPACAARRGLLHLTPDSCWLALHVGHLALLLWRYTSSLRQLEGGLHHLAPLTGVVNAMAAKLGVGPLSGRDVLFWVWLLLEVCAYKVTTSDVPPCLTMLSRACSLHLVNASCFQ